MKEFLKNLVRITHLIVILDPLRSLFSFIPWLNSNRKFKKKYPNYLLPPGHLAYDAYGGQDWLHYKSSGEGAAKFVIKKLSPIIREQEAAILEWGCGPGRIIRNIPNNCPSTWKLFGSDYNSESVEWCKRHFKNITFVKNSLSPPLDFPDESFNAIYAISVLTHLSELQYGLWLDEISRVLKRSGGFLFSTQGANTKVSLLEKEKKIFNDKGIVSRTNFKEGKKSYGTFHNPEFVKKMLPSAFKIIEFKECGMYRMKQDLWLVQKV